MLYRTQGPQALAVSKEQTAIGGSEEMDAHHVAAVPVTVEESSTSHRLDWSSNDEPKCRPGTVD